jgi:hypothetical protein
LAHGSKRSFGKNKIDVLGAIIMLKDSLLTLSLFLSVIGLIILSILLSQPVNLKTNIPNSNFIVGSLFSLLCILGSAAVFYPKKCFKTRILNIERDQQVTKYTFISNSKTKVAGHHPNCNKFEGNRFRFHGGASCSACLGLFVGALIALTGSAFYFLFETRLPPLDLKFLLIAYGLILLGLAQFKFRKTVKSVANALFVVGSMGMLITVDSIARSLFVDLFALGLIALLLLTRIRISEWYNKKICGSCADCVLDY